MQRHKIVAQIILLILSAINFVLAAPVLERRIHEVRIDVVNIAKDMPVTIVSQKRWNPSDRRSTTAVLADGANMPQNLESSDSDYRLEQDLRPLHDPRSPMDSNDSPYWQPANLPVGSTDMDNSHPFPVDPPPPEHDDLQFDIDLSDHAPPQPGQGPTYGPDSGSYSTAPPTHSSSYQSTVSIPDYPWSSDSEPEEASALPMSPSSLQSHDSNPPLHDNLDTFFKPFNLPSPTALSDPGPNWPYSPTDSVRTVSDLGPSRMPYSPSDSDESTGTYSSSDSVQSTWVHPPSPPSQGPPQDDL
jgi:hypothetical protein